eukprot:m.177469 g.177469  ORF g.177469 m.177469 type:complete len:695 (+) comp17966_c0_seq2:173-2257(+)
MGVLGTVVSAAAAVMAYAVMREDISFEAGLAVCVGCAGVWFLSSFPAGSSLFSCNTEYIMYRLDYWFSTSKSSKPLALLIATVVLIAICGVLLEIVEPQGLSTALWVSWTWVADTGAHTELPFGMSRVVAFIGTIGGMIVFALLVGIVADEISEQVDNLRKGTTQVLESGHTLILNWSDKTLPLLTELALANESEGGGVVVILSDHDKTKMEEWIETAEIDLKGTKVVCRSGRPTSGTDLARVSSTTARSIVVLSPPDAAPDAADADVLRVVLSLVYKLDEEQETPHIVVELCDMDNEQLVQLVGKNRVETVVSHDVIGRLMIQCARQPMMGQILAEILSFDGCEIYMEEWPVLEGVTFSSVAFAFDDAIPIGVVSSDGIHLNPSDDLVLAPGDRVVVIAEDDDTYKPKVRRTAPSPGILPPWKPDTPVPEKFLFINWRRDMDDMIVALDKQVPKGSILYLFSGKPEREQIKALREGGLDPTMLRNLRVFYRTGNSVLRKNLEELKLEEFHSILVLAEESDDHRHASDSRSLATLLLVRDIQDTRRNQRSPRRAVLSPMSLSTPLPEVTSLVSEVLDPHTRVLVSQIDKSDYVMSNDILSAAIAQISENRNLNPVFRELLGADGAEFYLRPARMYVWDNEEACFWDIAARARARNETALGYRVNGVNKAIINPPDKEARRVWGPLDEVLVLSED